MSLSVAQLGAVDDAITRQSLRGVRALDVRVELEGAYNALGLTSDDIQTDVELHCRQAGVEINKALIEPFLYIYVHVMQEKFKSGQPSDDYAVKIEVKFHQRATLTRAPEIRLVATTWEVGSLITGSSDGLRSLCRDSIRNKVDKFLNAFLEQNPKATR